MVGPNIYSTFTHEQDEKSVIIDMIMNEAKMKKEEKRTSERVKAKKARTRRRQQGASRAVRHGDEHVQPCYVDSVLL